MVTMGFQSIVMNTELKIKFITILNRVQAFEVWGRDEKDHQEFINEIYIKIDHLRGFYCIDEKYCSEKLVELDLLLNKRFNDCDGHIKGNIVEFLQHFYTIGHRTCWGDNEEISKRVKESGSSALHVGSLKSNFPIFR